MKKLAYFLILFVTFSTFAARRETAEPTRTHSGPNSSAQSSNILGAGYVQMLHWRTFVVFYMAHCARGDSDEVGRYVTKIGGYLQSKTEASKAGQEYLRENRYTRTARGSGTGDGGGSAYGAASADECGTDLANIYQQQFGSQGESAFCSSNRAKYQALIVDKDPVSVKAKAEQVVSSTSPTSLFSNGVCSPQSNKVNFDTQVNVTDKADLPAFNQSGTIAAQPLPPVPTESTQPQSAMRTRPQHPNQQAGVTAADNEAPPKGIQTASTTKPVATSAKSNKEVATASAGGVTGASSSEDSGKPIVQSTGDHQTRVAQAQTPPSKNIKSDVASTSTTQSVAAPLLSLKEKDYKKLFETSPACRRDTSAEDSLNHRLAYMDALINSYYKNCAKNNNSNELSAYNTHMNDYMGGIKNVQASFNYLQREQGLSVQKEYCSTRTNFYKATTESPSAPAIKKFAEEKMCK